MEALIGIILFMGIVVGANQQNTVAELKEGVMYHQDQIELMDEKSKSAAERIDNLWITAEELNQLQINLAGAHSASAARDRVDIEGLQEQVEMLLKSVDANRSALIELLSISQPVPGE